jgi:hypothetical protein
VDSLKALDPNRPIREADMCSALTHVAMGHEQTHVPKQPSGRTSRCGPWCGAESSPGRSSGRSASLRLRQSISRHVTRQTPRRRNDHPSCRSCRTMQPSDLGERAYPGEAARAPSGACRMNRYRLRVPSPSADGVGRARCRQCSGLDHFSPLRHQRWRAPVCLSESLHRFHDGWDIVGSANSRRNGSARQKPSRQRDTHAENALYVVGNDHQGRGRFHHCDQSDTCCHHPSWPSPGFYPKWLLSKWA